MTLYFLTENQFIHVLNILHFPVCVTFPEKMINFTNQLCVLNCCSECNGEFFSGAEMNGEKDVDLPFIYFIIMKI